MVRIHELVGFLIEAKKFGFASDKKPVKNEDGSKQYVFEAPPFKYRDIYFGSAIDSGQEVVWHYDEPIWSMVYAGGMEVHSDDGHLVSECFDFLKTCLRLPKEFSIRGPSQHHVDDWSYFNHLEGDIDRFSGCESIQKDGIRIYSRDYAGRILRKGAVRCLAV